LAQIVQTLSKQGCGQMKTSDRSEVGWPANRFR